MTFSPVFSPSLTINDPVTSAELNQLDNDHVNSVDKRGDTITGTLNFSNTSSIDGYITINGTSTVVNSPFVLNGTGDALIGTTGNLVMTSGSDNVVVLDGGALSLGVSFASFVSGNSAPTWGQDLSTSATTAANFIIYAQSSSQSSSTGGDLQLSAGGGTSKSGGILLANGLQGSVTFAQQLMKYQPWQGNSNTQQMLPYVYSGVATAVSTTVGQTILSIPMPTSGTSVSVHLCFNAKNLSTPTNASAGTVVISATNHSGTITSAVTLLGIVHSNSTAVANSSTPIILNSSGTNLLILGANATVGYTADWQCTAHVSIN